MRMRILIALATLFVGAYMLLPIPWGGVKGAYNPITHLYWCSRPSSCLHEIGHKVDQESGWVSQSPAFSKAAIEYSRSGSPSTEQGIIAILLSQYPRDSYSHGHHVDMMAEIYAFLLQRSEGNPENMAYQFREFYDWRAVRMEMPQPPVFYR